MARALFEVPTVKAPCFRSVSRVQLVCSGTVVNSGDTLGGFDFMVPMDAQLITGASLLP
jgi:hypothetical protein